MINSKVRKILTGIILFLLVILAWEIISYLKLADTFLFPQPSKLIDTACAMLRTGELQQNILVTLKRLILGFFLGGILGLIVGLLCGLSKKINSFIEPLVYLIYPIPKFALLPFIVLIFGIGMVPKIIFIGMGAFFPVAINTISGIKNINNNFLEVATHYGASGWKLCKRVIFPAILPSIFAGLRISIGLTLSYTVVIEFLTATDGLGAMMWLSLQTLRIDKLLLGVTITALLSVIFISLIIYLEKFFTPWHKEEKDIRI